MCARPSQTHLGDSIQAPNGESPGSDRRGPGVSVTDTALPSGDPNCPDGGSSFTAAGGTTYACNGAQGPAGTFGSVTVRTSSFTVAAPTLVDDCASCPPGEVAVGGGASIGAGNGSGLQGGYVETSSPDPVSGYPHGLVRHPPEPDEQPSAGQRLRHLRGQ